MSSLDLYAKIEPLIGFYKDYERLYDRYLEILNIYKPKDVLEIGFGRGEFLKHLKSLGYEVAGVEKSKFFLKKALKDGFEVKSDLKDFNKIFFCAVAIGDVLNYMNEKELADFFKDLKKILTKEAIFIADINTKYGFEEVTAGAMIKEENGKFLAIDSEFEDDKLITDIFLFEKSRECYKKESARIVQYFYLPKDIERISFLKLEKVEPFSLFSDLPDKEILILKNV